AEMGEYPIIHNFPILLKTKAFWSRIARELSPYVPGEQPRIANLVKLNTNESPFGPSPLALEAMRAAAVDTLRRHPDPEAQELREALAVHHWSLAFSRVAR